MPVEITALHWTFSLFIVLIMAAMLLRRDSSLLCITGVFILGCFATASLSQAVIGVFNSFVYAVSELAGTILVISIIVAMGKVLSGTGINECMAAPFARIIRSPGMAYWLTGGFMMGVSWFFWPSPAVALMGAVLLPVGRRVGLPAIGMAMAMNLFGHGIALSGDWVIQAAPKLTADAAGIPVQDVVSASLPLVLVMGLVTVSVAYLMLRRDMANGSLVVEAAEKNTAGVRLSQMDFALGDRLKKLLAAVIPLLFAIDVAVMYKLNLRGSDATALIGGTAIFILVLIALLSHRGRVLEQTTTYLVEGFTFGMTVFGPIIPIAAFFYLGDDGFLAIFGPALPAGSNGLVNDLGMLLAQSVPINAAVGAFTITIVGMITGLDGSGFSGISLVGSLAKLFSVSTGSGIATMTALGQIAAIFTGGGTLIPWSVIAVAAICNVSPFELARRNLLPVLSGLLAMAVAGALLI
ncbi:hypothetical protein HSX37_10830|uniref:H+/gluconate symporter n=1 Tax=Dendrosporobacter quercicolus TaxID=146817 RepID=A0A1G9T771_9FIRM|nr:hypothetical protein [Dendrosporobacter quercicolus]NSL48525.1 hypothetical protein [Dendrosporobacter quercicolus DSM 1736]SDM43496.1 hypothetical protein SAMN04488502_104234 [Dendrosporobacter quercicolus]